MVRKGSGVGVMNSFGALDLKTETKMLSLGCFDKSYLSAYNFNTVEQ